MVCKNCGHDLTEGTPYCPKCGKAQESQPQESQVVDLKALSEKAKANLSLILIGTQVLGFFINLFAGAFGGLIVMASMIVAIIVSMKGYKATRTSKGFKAYIEYIYTGATGKNPHASRLECLAVVTGIALYLVSVIIYMILSGQQTEDVYYYETWTFWY